MSSTMLGGGGTDTPTDENTDECVPANDKDEQPIDDAPSSILHHHGGGGGYTGTASNIESIVTSILGDIPAAAAPTSANDALSGSQVASASGIHSGVFAPSNSQVPCDSDMSHFLSASSGILSNSQVASNTGAPSSMQAPTPSRSGDAILDPNVTQEPQPSSSPSATGIDWRSVASSYRSIGEHEGSKWRDWASSKFGPWQDGPSSSLRLHVETSPALPQNANGGDEDTKE